MAQTASFKIRRRDSERVVSDILVPKEELRIGSQQVDIDLILNHPAVSPVHAIIREINGRLWIVDILDANATLLNGNSINEAPLLDRDEIQIGPFSLRVHFEPDALLIIVERRLKAAVSTTADSAGQRGASVRFAGMGRDEQDALRIFWQDRKREAGKIAISTPLYPVGIYGKGKARFNWTSTGDLKPPIRREVWLTRVVMTVVLASIGALFFWSNIYSPGPLASAHSSSATVDRGIALRTVSSCSDCHHLFGNKERDCIDCHKVPVSSVASTRGFDPRISDAHRDANIGCVGCHSEHNGPEFPIKEVDNRSCMSCHNDQYEFRGRVVGSPHKGSAAKSNTDSSEKPGVGYIRGADGVLTWNKQTGKEAVTLFHAEHPYTQKCNYCHQPGSWRTEKWETSPRAACQACHAVSFDAGGLKAIGPNCATCHKQHGKLKDLKSAITRIPIPDSELRQFLEKVRSSGLYSLGDTTGPFISSEIGGASVKRQGRVNWKDWDFTSRLGFASYIWTASIGIFALGGTVLVAFGNIRRRKLLREESNRLRIPRDARADQETRGNRRIPPPAYTFPRIDPDRCIGCYACIEACPHDVLAMSHEKIATPIALTQCLDDTKCQTACPTQACIVANTEKVIPERDRPDRNHVTYVTNVPGLYVIGEVARIPLIKFAIVEGAYVIDHIEKELKEEAGDPVAQYDVAIIGAGPAGLSAALRAVEKKLTYLVIERHEVLATINGYPLGKSVNLKTDGDEPKGLLPLPPSQDQRWREEIIEYWMGLLTSHRIKINEHEECTNIERKDEVFTVTTVQGEGCTPVTYTSRRIVLAIGSSGTPSINVKGVELTIPIERSATKCPKCGAPRPPHQEICFSCNFKIDQSATEIHADGKVKYKLSDPGSYDRKKCVVVGGGNSAIEAAVQLTGFKPGQNGITFARDNDVTLLVRSYFTPDLKFVNKMNLYDCWDAGRIDVRFGTEIKEIREGEVILMNDKKQETDRIRNDYVFYCIGTRWPENFLVKLGIRILKMEKAN